MINFAADCTQRSSNGWPGVVVFVATLATMVAVVWLVQRS